MEFAGIITEYDPFHNGHAAQLAAVDKALTGALANLQKISDLSIANQRYKKFRVMGGNGYQDGN